MILDTTTGLPYVGDARKDALVQPFIGGMRPGKSLGSMRFVGETAKAPGAGATSTPTSSTVSPYVAPTETLYTPPATESVYRAPTTTTVPATNYAYRPPVITPNDEWIAGVPNIVTGVAGAALAYALYKTFFAPETLVRQRENPDNKRIDFSSIDKEQAEEFSRRRNLPHVEVRHMNGARYSTVSISRGGRQLGEKTENIKHGKTVSISYFLPDLHGEDR